MDWLRRRRRDDYEQEPRETLREGYMRTDHGQAPLANVLSRYHSQDAVRSPDWFWWNLTPTESRAISLAGVVSVAEKNAQINLAASGDVGGKVKDQRVTKWHRSGYTVPWQEFIK
jgi:hypothetical protein